MLQDVVSDILTIMSQVSTRPIPKKVKNKIFVLLIKSLQKASKREEIVPFITDLLTPTERIMIAKRLSIAFLLLKGEYSHREISKVLRVSTNTISNISLILKTGGNGYRQMVNKLMKEKEMKIVLNEIYEILTLVPHKGQNWGEWKKDRLARKRKLEEPF